VNGKTKTKTKLVDIDVLERFEAVDFNIGSGAGCDVWEGRKYLSLRAGYFGVGR
jgi:hypothetical protein